MNDIITPCLLINTANKFAIIDLTGNVSVLSLQLVHTSSKWLKNCYCRFNESAMLRGRSAP